MALSYLVSISGSFQNSFVKFYIERLSWLGRCITRSLRLAGVSGRFLMDGFILPTHIYRMSLLLQSTVYTLAIIRKSPCKCIAISCSTFQGDPTVVEAGLKHV